MADSPALPLRPTPPRRVVDRAGAWLAWIGLGRLAAAACCTLAVGAGGYWLVRAPTPPSEAGIPYASAPPVAGAGSGSSSSPAGAAATLPTPVGPAAGGEQGVLVVHVVGAVVSAGVYRLAPGARVLDAVEAAGGAASGADLAGLNLAAPVADGVRIYVPALGEIDPASVPSGLAADGGGASSGPVDLNRATVEQLDALPGVGPATAAAIVDDRERNGPFASVDDLDRVPGIGPAKLAALRDLVSV
jgi:competence protein ComEA